MGFVKIIPTIPSFQPWLVGFSLMLMFLVLWSQLSDIGILSNTKRAHLIPATTTRTLAAAAGGGGPPALAYWIMGGGGDGRRMMRLLKAIYHPRNRYLLQLDSSAMESERVELAIWAEGLGRVFSEFGNIDVVGESYGVNRMGASGLGAVLHAAALLLRIDGGDWDWFVPLTASDYPLLTQDDILYAFSSLPKDTNFMAYTNDTAWKKRQNVSRVAVDPNLYHKENRPVFYAAETREEPNAFWIFGGLYTLLNHNSVRSEYTISEKGSPWMILSRNFVEHCVKGWDNFPRKLLMYSSNVAFPLESYFQTVLCNTPEFHNTTIVNDDLRYIVNRNETLNITTIKISNRDSKTTRRTIFVGPFEENDPKLQAIDEQLLKLDKNGIVRGKWCEKRRIMNETEPRLMNSTIASENLCSSSKGDVDSLESGVLGTLLRTYLSSVVKENELASGLCRSHVIRNERKK
ncbi:Core-2/I-branching beta-1,6-N-acetylglucosaminyltransferase family protein [Striga asiatica]|uniref:Core-2/I-branching beta-1,6-N-acetylglucosaminyltransferase family protein n=1 Tax=Striga asiatica TaxID=4170 RepID=A0A5A7P6A2_STRAF|nr:Core-2/I-branching beta-1,6-N-acetylglucosaminyltransferase family protein [Striga asiatica]